MYKKIETPFSIINKLLKKHSDKIYEIFGCKEYEANTLIFQNDSILIFGCIKIFFDDANKFIIKFYGNFDQRKLRLLTVLGDEENVKELKYILRNYIYTISTIGTNLEHKVSEDFINSIYDKIVQYKTDEYWPIHIENKINQLFPNIILKEKAIRYSYILKYVSYDKATDSFNFSIVQCLSSLLSDAKSLNNMRMLDIETLHKCVIPRTKLEHFLTRLFFYGEITTLDIDK